MSTKTKYPPRRNKARGFVHAAGLMSGQMRKATGSRGFSQARLLTHWEEVVGPALAKITRPSKVSFAKEGFGATLTIFVNGARAPEVQMQLQDIRARVNACYGYNAISRVRISQVDRHGIGFAEDQADFTNDRPVPELSAEDEKALGLENVIDDGLRAALLDLSKNVLSREP